MQGLWRGRALRVRGHRFRQEVREGFSEEATLSEHCLISGRQILAVVGGARTWRCEVSVTGTETGVVWP